MARSLALAALLLLTLLWTATAWAKPEGVAASFLVTSTTPAGADLTITTRVAVTDSNIITVTTTNDELIDDGDCSLREAIEAADTDSTIDSCVAGSGGDTINIPAGDYQLTLGQLHLTDTITLQGSVTDTTILDGSQASRVLYVEAQAIVTLRYLEIRNGDGGCCDTNPADGGGIANFGTLSIAYSTVHDNHAGIEVGDAGKGIGADGGGIYNAGILIVTNSTISSNSAGNGYCITHGGYPTCGGPGDGGGIANLGTLRLDNATIANNQPGTAKNEQYQPYFGSGGGIANEGGTTLKNSIIASNEVTDCSGTLTSLGNNIAQNVTGCAIRGNYSRWSAHLGSLTDNGGPTLTHALASNSAAIDAGDCTDSTGKTIAVDQRGEPRPQGDGCDIGAYESSYTSTFTITDTNLPLISR